VDIIASHLGLDTAQFAGGTDNHFERYDSRFLLSALLVFVAKGDGNISSLESQKLIELLCSKFGIRSAEALEDLSYAVMALADDAGIPRKLRKISQSLSIDEKIDVFTMMLEVAAVDGKQEAGEIRAINVAAQIMDMPQAAIHTAFEAYFSNH
jgi:uncharacterized tellurite resistance protein B-like protein